WCSVGWWLYAAVALYVAVNVPIACLLSTPLTWPLIRAARGALGDSILYHVTAINLLRVGLVLGTAVMVPVAWRRWRITRGPRATAVLVGVGLVAVILGPAATARLDTMGLHRNVVGVLLTTALPRVAAEDFAGEWRLSPFGSREGEDLTRFRGAAD